jgi:hypothetical protein
VEEPRALAREGSPQESSFSPKKTLSDIPVFDLANGFTGLEKKIVKKSGTSRLFRVDFFYLSVIEYISSGPVNKPI